MGFFNINIWGKWKIAAATWGVIDKKVSEKFCNIHREKPAFEFLFNYIAGIEGLQDCKFITNPLSICSSIFSFAFEFESQWRKQCISSSVQKNHFLILSTFFFITIAVLSFVFFPNGCFFHQNILKLYYKF